MPQGTGDTETLPDLLADGLDIVSVGLNPSPPSVRAGTYFANPRNRFWPALNGSGLIDEALQPGPEAMRRLLERHRIGFTDLVKRPTPGAAGLRAADYRTGAPLLQTKLLSHRPRLIWFHGKVAWANFLKYGPGGVARIDWGLQPMAIGASPVFVTPNPSPANAAFSLELLIEHYRALKRLRDALLTAD
ncbi:mismatch-specific DNA-glycosylase [Thiohalobacter sp. IOR34]|uniref:mismatch-specific DNA-glycosylase n=1 Tax=Thiohalobacter sp. IOR34 TaxID=3057176 RepID=UPI0025AF617E|nr:mismatch-specific DNA-glycosylase [Thiohalobacter sp. IOR34]WJW76121.1 mismatch-specific DNA-glycosylase [Thiohalobacter sp. IOR34]